MKIRVEDELSSQSFLILEEVARDCSASRFGRFTSV